MRSRDKAAQVIMDVGKLITQFWDWFVVSADHLSAMASAGKARELNDIVGPRVREFDQNLGWEIGPGLDKDWGLAISPNGVRNRLGLTQRIVASAPPMFQWEFYPAKPPKRWHGFFQMRNSRGQVVGINTRRWQYALTSYDDGSFVDITIVAPDTDRIDIDGRKAAAYIALDSDLGEQRVLESIGAVDVELAATPSLLGRLTKFEKLAQHLGELGL